MRFIDLFSGIGGFRLGLEANGHNCVGWVEKNKFAQKSYKNIFNTKGEFFKNDIRHIQPRKLPKAEVYTAGFPCQSFSIAGKRGGFEDTRGTLFFEIARLVKERQPKYLFLENVRGLLSHDGGNTFATVLNTLSELGYFTEWQVLNSKDFGVPQNRERVFIIGHLGEFGEGQVFPIRRKTKEANKKNDRETTIINNQLRPKSRPSVQKGEQSGGSGILFNNKYSYCLAKTPHYVYQGLNTTKENNSFCIDKNYAKGVNPRGLGSGRRAQVIESVMTPDFVNKNMNKKLPIDSKNGNMFTIDETSQHGITDGVRIRKLTPKECWRLQGFPDWAFEKAQEVNSDTQLYKQAGNAVTVPVVKYITKFLTKG